MGDDDDGDGDVRIIHGTTEEEYGNQITSGVLEERIADYENIVQEIEDPNEALDYLTSQLQKLSV